MVDALFLGRFATGEQPHSRSRSLDRVRPGSTLLPPGATVLRSARADDRSAVLAEGEGWTLLVSRWNRGADVTVTAVDDGLAERVLEQATDGALDEPEPRPGDVAMGFWYLSPRRGPHRTTRQIAAGAWADVRSNYTAPVADALDRLMGVTPGTSRAGCCSCTVRPVRARRPRCARSPANGGTGARWTASSTRSGCSGTSAT